MRLMIVDDSALMRRMLSECFSNEPDTEIAVARDGEDALATAREFQPDVITLDINMPKMDGLTCLAHLSEVWPCPVIMVSSLTERGALATFEALELGAIDFVAKPGGTVSLNMDDVFEELRQKVRGAARARRMAKNPATAAPPPKPRPKPATPARGGTGTTGADLVMIGCSTGGPKTLSLILPDLPADFAAPILIAQHMPNRFTGVLASRLASACAIQVQELRAPTPLVPGCAYIATGGMDVELATKQGQLFGRPVPASENFTWHPSVSRMVASAKSHVAPKRCVSVMLTGMGDDGAAEMTELHQEGARTIAENESSAAIFGMPHRLIALGGASEILHANQIAQQMTEWVNGATAGRTLECR